MMMDSGDQVVDVDVDVDVDDDDDDGGDDDDDDDDGDDDGVLSHKFEVTQHIFLLTD